MQDRNLWFVRFAQSVSQFTGQPVTSFMAVGTIVVWAISGRRSDSAILGSSLEAPR
jgi:low affinity Fe/Cu permease